MSLFSSGKYSTLKIVKPSERRMTIPDGSWVKCKYCGQTLYNDRLEDNLQVCWNCEAHLPMSTASRIAMLTDSGSFTEIDNNLCSKDFLAFMDSKSYAKRIAENESKTGRKDAITCGRASLNGRKYMLGVMDFSFMGASMGCDGKASRSCHSCIWQSNQTNLPGCAYHYRRNRGKSAQNGSL